MKKNKSAIISNIVAASLMTIATSVMASPKPAACPTADAIIKEGFFLVQKDNKKKVYIAGQLSNYDTENQWGFGITVPFDQATSISDARNKAKEALLTLTGSPSPLPYEEIWYCEYHDSYGYEAYAITPFSLGVMHDKAQAAKMSLQNK